LAEEHHGHRVLLCGFVKTDRKSTPCTIVTAAMSLGDIHEVQQRRHNAAEDHEQHSRVLVHSFLPKRNYSPSRKQRIVDCGGL
jgi:hypothetical protein